MARSVGAVRAGRKPTRLGAPSPVVSTNMVPVKSCPGSQAVPGGMPRAVSNSECSLSGIGREQYIDAIRGTVSDGGMNTSVE